jgi:hypothetical protein
LKGDIFFGTFLLAKLAYFIRQPLSSSRFQNFKLNEQVLERFYLCGVLYFFFEQVGGGSTAQIN